MRLRLVLEGPERLMKAAHEKVVETGGIVIGRSSEADWAILDPTRIISKTHCRIDADAGGYSVTDTSTNGVRVNGKPVDYGHARPLAHGDMLILGDAVIRVEIEAQLDRPAASSSSTSKAGIDPVDSPFMEGPFGFDDGRSASTKTQPMGVFAPTAQQAKEPVLQDWWNPAATPEQAGRPKTVDISADNVKAAIAYTNDQMEQLASPDDRAASLLAMSDGIDVKAFVRVVEMAVKILSEGERQKFDGRIRELLREEKSRWQ